jgi:hypothetical protein
MRSRVLRSCDPPSVADVVASGHESDRHEHEHDERDDRPHDLRPASEVLQDRGDAAREEHEQRNEQVAEEPRDGTGIRDPQDQDHCDRSHRESERRVSLAEQRARADQYEQREYDRNPSRPGEEHDAVDLDEGRDEDLVDGGCDQPSEPDLDAVCLT